MTRAYGFWNGRTADFGFAASRVRIPQHPHLSVDSLSHEHTPKGAKRAHNGAPFTRFSPRAGGAP